MRILMDECVDQRRRLLITGHDCQTAACAKLSGLKNGVLLAAADHFSRISEFEGFLSSCYAPEPIG